ncbi:MAG: DUF6088 family protein, partial [Candidatus Zixiibacteriota bacterium]
KEIEKDLKSKNKGVLLFISDFSDIGDYDTVRKSLQRLTDKGLLIRLSKGVYYYPKHDEILGILYPNTEQIANAIAMRDQARIIPTGLYALHLLGISTQIPMNVVYLTDGSARKIEIGNQTVLFKKTSPKNLSAKHKLSNLIIQGLRTIGETNLTRNERSKIKEIVLNSGEIENVKEDIRYAPIWIQKIVLEFFKEDQNEKLA